MPALTSPGSCLAGLLDEGQDLAVLARGAPGRRRRRPRPGAGRSSPAPRARSCARSSAVRSRSVRTSPLSARKRSPSPRRAGRRRSGSPRAVPSGSRLGDVADAGPGALAVAERLAQRRRAGSRRRAPPRRPRGRPATRSCRRGTAGRPAVSAGFGTDSVSGRSRVPSPPTRTIACIASVGAVGEAALDGAADALVGEAGRAERPGSRKLRPSTSSGRAIRSAAAGPVEVGELGPLGDQHRRRRRRRAPPSPRRRSRPRRAAPAAARSPTGS